MQKQPHFTADDLERELTAQFERFRQLAGRLPDHLDSHHGSTYMNSAAFNIMLGLATTHNLPIRWATMLDETSSDGLQAKPRSTDYLVDFIFDFESSPRLERLQSGLRRIQEGYTELFVHVGYPENLQEDYTFQREEELVAVTDASVKQIIEAEGIHLCTFGDLP
jgi:predicted glycoside hydrolase/deacetylase ChbG (UPF0249 family)